MRYVNKNTGDIIGLEVYSQLSSEARGNFVSIKEDSQATKTHQVIETKSDSMSVGDGIACAALIPAMVILSIFD